MSVTLTSYTTNTASEWAFPSGSVAGSRKRGQYIARGLLAACVLELSILGVISHESSLQFRNAQNEASLVGYI